MSRHLAYYNEIDEAASHVLRHLIRAGVIAPGEVDTRSIKDVSPDEAIRALPWPLSQAEPSEEAAAAPEANPDNVVRLPRSGDK